MSITHAHGCLVDIETLLLEVTELESGHDHMIGLLCIEALCTRNIRCEWSDAVYKTFLYEVLAKVHVIFFTHSECYVERTGPVALCQHFQHHQVTLVESALACQRNNHLVRDRICSHHHAALLYCLLVDSDIEGIGWDEVHIRVLAAYPVLQNVLQLERLIAKLLLGILRILLVEFKNLLLCFRLYRYIFVGT